MTEWRLLANLWNGSYPPNENILADWEAAWEWRDAAPDRKLAARPRLELVADGARGGSDIADLGPWNAMQKGWRQLWPAWRDSGHGLKFDLPWIQNPLLFQLPNWLGYWIVVQGAYLQLQQLVFDVYNHEYQDWVVPRIDRYFRESKADAYHFGIKWDRMEQPTIHHSVPGGIIDVRTGVVKPGGNVQDMVSRMGSPWFSEGMREIMRRLDKPFFTALQLIPPLKADGTPGTWTLATYTAAVRAWLGPDLEPLWLGPGKFVDAAGETLEADVLECDELA